MNNAVGKTTAPLLVVMAAPPSEGMEAWFWRVLHSCGIKKTDVRIVYMLDSVPKGSGGKPLKEQIRTARDRFEREIRESKPSVVMPMGRDPFYELTGIDEPIFDARGYLIHAKMFLNRPVEVWKQVGVYKAKSKTGAKKGDPKMKWVKEAQPGLLGLKFKGVVIPTFTLDHIRTEQFALKPAFKEDVSRIARALKGELHQIDSKFTYLRTIPVKMPKFGDIIAIDIETHGMNNEVIDLVSFSDGTTTFVLDWSEDARVFVGSLFLLPGRTYAIHNSQFDVPRLMANGVTISQKVLDTQVFDTMFAAVTIQPDLHKALGRVASLYLDLTPWKTSSRNENSPWRVMVNADPYTYAAKDAFVTAWIAKQEIVVMKNLGCWNLFMGQGGHPGPGEMATLPVLEEMSRGGILIDSAGATIWNRMLQRRLLRYMKMWSRMFPEVSPTSGVQIRKLFYNEWNLPIQRSSDDRVSLDELSLVKLGAFVEVQRGSKFFPGKWHKDKRCNQRTFDLLLKMRETSKMLGTYIVPAEMNLMGRVHPQYLPVSKDDEKGGKKMGSKGNTATGRLASYNPNIQNQPKKVRKLYVPDAPNMCFIQADYKSAELYVLAGMSGDMNLLQDLKGDMHQRNADRRGIERPTVKNVTYASQYLAGPSKQSEMILEQAHIYVSPSECLTISQAIWGYYTEATAYKHYLIELCNKQRYIINPFGRIRFFHDGAATAAVNFIPQSTVADILWCVLKPVADLAKKYGGRLVTTVHDSILVCVPMHVRDKVAWEMKEIMERRFDNIRKDFYIPVELEVGEPGDSWGSLKKMEVA